MQNCSKCGKCVTLHEKGIKNVRNLLLPSLCGGLGSRIGTGNLAGVATAISIGGPGAVFWMWMLSRQAVFLLQDYRKQKKEGKNPVFKKEMMPEIADKLEAW